jgi:hypothetical protein
MVFRQDLGRMGSFAGFTIWSSAIAADRKQARVVFRYISRFLDTVPMLSSMIEHRTKESLVLNNRVVIEVHTANFKAVHGYTIVAAVCDEIAFWRSEDSANPDIEILNGLIILDALRESKPPFVPTQVVQEFSSLMRRYGIRRVTGDRYDGDWPREQFRNGGIQYETSDLPKTDLYRELLPSINSVRIDLLDHQRLINQLLSLERRTSRG